MTQPYASFGVAASVEPLSTTSSNTLLRDADPAIFFALDFWSWLITNLPGPRLVQAAVASGAPISAAVAQRYPLDPKPEQLSVQLKLPLLAVYRKSSEYKWKRVGFDSDFCEFDLLYVLPPLTAGQAEQILPILRAVEATLRHETTYGFHPGYTPPGGQAGQQPWGPSFANLEEIDFNRGFRGSIEGSGELMFPALRIEGTFVERDMYVSNGNAFAGGDVTVNLTNTDGTDVPAFVQVATQQAPKVTSLSVTTGPHAGGTAVTITGALFLSNPVVMFGTTPATSVAFVNATTITCVAPAVSGAGTLGIVVVNRDGQSGSLANAFTFT